MGGQKPNLIYYLAEKGEKEIKSSGINGRNKRDGNNSP
jgi:hypothetical protein